MHWSPSPSDVGSPWAIGAAEGGHKDILPQLGTFEDFRHLLAKAREFGIEIALDIAFQCAPDHPYVNAHPQWFKHRPDGSVQYAENPPKKYQDIYPFDFETEDWRALWQELKSIVDHLDRPGREDFSGRQSAHQVVRFLGVADRRDQARSAGRHFSGRGLYTAQGHAPSGEARLLAVVHVLHVAQYQAGTHGLFHRPRRGDRDANTTGPTCGRTRPISCTKRCSRVFGRCMRHAWCLRRRWPANYGIYGPTYELLESTPREAGQRGVPRLGKISVAALVRGAGPTACGR